MLASEDEINEVGSTEEKELWDKITQDIFARRRIQNSRNQKRIQHILSWADSWSDNKDDGFGEMQKRSLNRRKG